MKEKKLKLQEELARLREELGGIDRRNLDSETLKAEISRLTARRAELEKKLIEDVFSADPDNLPGAWQGLRKGMIAALRGLEEALAAHDAAPAVPAPEAARSPRFSALRERLAAAAASPAFRWIAAFALVYLLLVAVGCLGAGFKEAFGGTEGAKSLFRFATNPFMGLVVGILSTALIQSSSTTTSIVVALCAAGMPIEAAVPMIMGANVGTSVTNTLVSLGSIGNRRTFRRAFAAATVHDFFNLLAIVIFLPLEIAFHLLEKLSGWFSGLLYGSGGLDLDGLNFLKPILKPAERGAQQLFAALPGPEWIGNAAFIVFGLVLIFFSILCLGKLLRGLLTGRAEKIFHYAVGRSPLTAIASGLLITVLVQSSSTTTSLVVPLAAAGVMTLPQVYPFTLGANIGTCVTALLAAFAITGAGAAPALQVALIHLLFNSIGVALIYSIAFLRGIPLSCASGLAALASRRKGLAFLYVVGVFFLLPLVCLGVYRLF